jgi:Holliday junction resolvase
MNAAERELQIDCETRLHKRGWRTYRLQMVGSRGWCDTIAVKGKRTLFIEFKVDSPESPQQKIIRDGLLNAGAEAFVTKSWHEIDMRI